MDEIDLLVAALRLNSIREQEAFLERECIGDSAKLAKLLRLVSISQSRGESPTLDNSEHRKWAEALLAEDDTRAETMPSNLGDERPADLDATQDADSSGSPAALSKTEDYTSGGSPENLIAGRYILQSRIGEGGMGEVWRAKQNEPIKRTVAIKLIKKGMDSKAVLNRFEQERQALALMDHPNIARVLDGGMTDNGQPFFAMELVSGLPLIDYADKERLNTEQRLNLFVLICNAVQHAHQKGIVHRDLKPANILVHSVDGKPVPKVIDFGVAKATGGNLTDESMGTQIGAIIGTLEYMAPEQAGFTGFDIDTRADIYSLGVVLYELLTGLRPIDRTRLREAGISEMIRVIREDEPSKPSTRLSTNESLPSMAAIRQIDPKKLTALLRGELDWVVMKCLEKERERRYETANSLARDIQRYLANEVIEARPPSRGYKLKKFVTKNRGQVISVGLVMLALLIGSIAATLGWLEAKRQTDLAIRATGEKEQALQQEALQAERERAARLDAEAMTQNALAANKAMVVDIQEELAPKPGLQTLRIKLLKKAREGLRDILEHGVQDTSPKETIVVSHYQLGEVEWNLGDIVAAKTEFQAGLEIASELGAAEATVETQRHLSNGYTKVGDASMLLGDSQEAITYFRLSREVNQGLIGSNPNDTEAERNLSIDLDKIGDVALRQGDPAEALKSYETALKIRTKLAQSDQSNVRYQRDLSSIHARLGDAKADLGNAAETQTHYRNALFISENLAKAHPDNVSVQRDFALNSSRVGNILRRYGKDDEAKGFYLDCLNVLKPLAEADPQNAEIKRDLGGIYQRIGDIALNAEDPDSAIQYYQQGLEISQTLSSIAIGSTEAQRDLSINNEKLGDVLLTFGRPDEALDYYTKALEISQRLAVTDPDNAQAQSDVGYGFLKLGEVMSRQAKFEEAIKYHQRALDLRKSQASKNPNSAGARTEVYRSYFLVGEAQMASADYSDAASSFENARGVLTEMREKGWYSDPEDTLGSWTVKENRKRLADYSWQCKSAPKAIADIEFVMSQDTDLLPQLMRVRVRGLLKSGPRAEALSSADRFAKWVEGQSDEIEPDKHSLNLYSSGCLYALAASNAAETKEAVARAVVQFELARKAGYFDESGASNLRQDSDLVAMRNHDLFISFLNSFGAAAEATQDATSSE